MADNSLPQFYADLFSLYSDRDKTTLFEDKDFKIVAYAEEEVVVLHML